MAMTIMLLKIMNKLLINSDQNIKMFNVSFATSILGSPSKTEKKQSTYRLKPTMNCWLRSDSSLSTAWDLTVLQSKTSLAIAEGTCWSRWRDKVNILKTICFERQTGMIHTTHGVEVQMSVSMIEV